MSHPYTSPDKYGKAIAQLIEKKNATPKEQNITTENVEAVGTRPVRDILTAGNNKHLYGKFSNFYYAYRIYSMQHDVDHYRILKQCFFRLCKGVRIDADEDLLALLQAKINVSRPRNALSFAELVDAFFASHGAETQLTASVQFWNVSEQKDEWQKHVLRLVESFEAKQRKKRGKNKEQKFISPKALPRNTVNTVSENDVIIYVIGGMTRCQREGHTIKTLNALVREGRTHGEVMIPIQRCETCRFYFIGAEELKNQEERYGKLFFNSRQGTPEEFDADLDAASILMKHGYTVNSRDDLSDKERHQLLDHIIQRGYISKSAAMQQLEYFIRYNGHRAGNENAKQKWKNDLDYLATCGNTGTLVRGTLASRKK